MFLVDGVVRPFHIISLKKIGSFGGPLVPIIRTEKKLKYNGCVNNLGSS